MRHTRLWERESSHRNNISMIANNMVKGGSQTLRDRIERFREESTAEQTRKHVTMTTENMQPNSKDAN